MGGKFYDFATTEVVDVNTGELKTTKDDGVLRSVAIGSCIVVACHDSNKKLGVMAHIMLPGRAPEMTAVKTKYAKDAIEKIENILFENSSDSDSVEVYLVGAGNVLRKENDTICKSNIESVTSILEDNGFRVVESVLGGFERKSIRMEVDNGAVYYTQGDGDEQLL